MYDPITEWLIGCDPSKPVVEANEFEREDALDELRNPLWCSTIPVDSRVITETNQSRAIMQSVTVQGTPVVVFDMVWKGSGKRLRFWFNAVSVKSISDKLRQCPRKNLFDAVHGL